mmetsp:Transcript_21350/g.42840  ORF Transcript_21350/g.42840 Transcript_21350/m.42840 type:complete len:80 (-) Transcript_21350:810-1049(-)
MKQADSHQPGKEANWKNNMRIYDATAPPDINNFDTSRERSSTPDGYNCTCSHDNISTTFCKPFPALEHDEKKQLSTQKP